MGEMRYIRINNSKKLAIKSAKEWTDPGAKLYDKLLDAFYCDGKIPADSKELDKAIKDGRYIQWFNYLEEAYLIAPVRNIKNSPYGRTPYSRSGCKYPHHVIKGKQMVLSIPGLMAAYKRACQHGVMKGKVKEHLMRHVKELGLEDSFKNLNESLYKTKNNTFNYTGVDKPRYAWKESSDELIESNFNSIYTVLMQETGINLFDNDIEFNETSHDRLKYDFGFDIMDIIPDDELINYLDEGFYEFLDEFNNNNYLVEDGNTNSNNTEKSKELFQKRWKYNSINKTISFEDRDFKIDIDTDCDVYKGKYKILGEEYEYNRKKPLVMVFRTIDGPVIVMNKEFWKYQEDMQDALILHEIGHIVCQMTPKPFPKSIKELIKRIKQAIQRLVARTKMRKYTKGVHGNGYDEIEADLWAAKRCSTDILKKAIEKGTIDTLINQRSELIKEIKKENPKDKFHEMYDNIRKINDKISFDDFYNKIIERIADNAIDDYKKNPMKINDLKQRTAALNDKELHDSKYFKKESTEFPSLNGDNTHLTSEIWKEIGGRTPGDLYKWMCDNIKYDGTIKGWKLKTPAELFKSKSGLCHDQSLFSCLLFNSLGYVCGQLFLTECSSTGNPDGNAHTLTWYREGGAKWSDYKEPYNEENSNNISGKYYWFETAWENYNGIHGPYNDIDELKQAVINAYNNDDDINSHNPKYNVLSIGTDSNYRCGMSMARYISSWIIKEVQRLNKNEELKNNSPGSTKLSDDNISDDELIESLDIGFYEFLEEIQYNRHLYESTNNHGIEEFKSRWKYNDKNSTIKFEDKEYYIDLNTDDVFYRRKIRNQIVAQRKDLAAAIRRNDGTLGIMVNEAFWNYEADEQDAIILHEIGHIVCQQSPRPFPKSVKELIERIKKAIRRLVARIRALRYSNGIHGKPFNEIEADAFAASRLSPDLMKRLIKKANEDDSEIDILIDNEVLKKVSVDKLKKEYQNYIRKHKGSNEELLDYDSWETKYLNELRKSVKQQIEKKMNIINRNSKKDTDQRTRALNDPKLQKHLILNPPKVNVFKESTIDKSSDNSNNLEIIPHEVNWEIRFDEDEVKHKGPGSINIMDEIKESFEWMDNFINDNEDIEEGITETVEWDNYQLFMKCETPEELLNKMDDINYGWISKKDGKYYGEGEDEDETEFFKYYYLQSPIQLCNSLIGVCWDQVQLERCWFDKHNIPYVTIYIEINDNDVCPTHTFLIYETEDGYNWFEHSWGIFKGIHKYTRMKDCITDVINKHQKFNNDNTSPVLVTSYDKPKVGSSCIEFMDHCRSSKKLDLNDIGNKVFSESKTEKNGTNRKKLYEAFVKYAKECNKNNVFNNIWDWKAFTETYPFVPYEMRYFYRLANPILCVLEDNLTFFQVSELEKLNSENDKFSDIIIFAATLDNMRVYNTKDKKVYMAVDNNGSLKIKELIATSFDEFIQMIVNQGDILNS